MANPKELEAAVFRGNMKSFLAIVVLFIGVWTTYVCVDYVFFKNKREAEQLSREVEEISKRADNAIKNLQSQSK